MDARLKTIVSNALKLKPDDIRPDVSRDTCKAWTSLAHLLLVTQIESSFGVQLATAQVVGIRTLADLEKVVGSAVGMPSRQPMSPRPVIRRADGVKPVALVTGSSRGIGAETTRSLARRGFAVVVHYLSQEDAARTVQEALVKDNVDAILVQADLSSAVDVSRLFDAISARWGRLDVLVNNAAPSVIPSAIEKLSRADLMTQIEAHVVSPLMISQSFLPLLQKASTASIVNVLSIFIHGAPPAGLSAYVAAKSALASLTRSMAREWAVYNIRVNALSPTITHTALSRGMDPAMLDEYTRRTPMGRMLEPREVGEAIAHLACEPAEYMTGAEVVLDGGLTMSW